MRDDCVQMIEDSVEDFDQSILSQVVDGQPNLLDVVMLQEIMELTRHELRTIFRYKFRWIPYMTKHSLQPLHDVTKPDVGGQQTLREVRRIVNNSNNEFLMTWCICEWT